MGDMAAVEPKQGNEQASGGLSLFMSILMLVVCGFFIISFISYISRGFSEKPVTMLDDCLVTSQFSDTVGSGKSERVVTTMYTTCGSFLITGESKTELQTGLTYDLQVRDGVLIDGTLVPDATTLPEEPQEPFLLSPGKVFS